MTSLIEQLQQDAVDRTVRTSDLLRKALLVAAKLEVPNVPSWIEKELSGYPLSGNLEKELPPYRFITGRVMGRNPMHGWQPIMFQSSAAEKMFSRRPVVDPVAGIETLLESTKGALYGTYPAEGEKALRESIGRRVEVACHMTRASMAAILDEVRNKVLLWSIELDRAGIRGDGVSFTREEKDKARGITINAASGTVNIGVIGDVNERAIIAAGPKAKAGVLDLSGVRLLIAELEQHKSVLAHAGADEKGLESALGALKVATADRNPRLKITKALELLKRATVSAGKSAVKAGIDALAEAAVRQMTAGG